MTMFDLEPASEAVKNLLPGITAGQMSRSTPCPEITVAGMLDHFVGLSFNFKRAAQKILNHGSPQPSASARNLTPRWRTVLPDQLDALVVAWRDPAAWDGVTWMGRELPAPLVAHFAVNELVIHGWDLAMATGQSFSVDEESVEASFRFLSSVPNEPSARFGVTPASE